MDSSNANGGTNLCLLCCFSYSPAAGPDQRQQIPEESSTGPPGVLADPLESDISNVPVPLPTPLVPLETATPPPGDSDDPLATPNPTPTPGRHGAMVTPPPTVTLDDPLLTPAPIITAASTIITENPEFKRFCQEIEGLSKDNLILTLTNQNFSSDILFNSLEFFKRLSVCPECLKLVSRVVEKNRRTQNTEQNVQALQQRLLTELKQLQKEVNELRDEMLGMERVISNSDVSCLENFLEGFMPPVMMELGAAAGEQKGSVHKASVILFRNNILAVVNDLQTFQRRLTSNLSCEPRRSPSVKKRQKKRYPKKKPKKKSKPVIDDTFSGINPLELVEVKTELTELGINLPSNEGEDDLNPLDPITGRNPRSGYGLRENIVILPELNLGDGAGGEGDEDTELLFEDNPEDDMDFELDDEVELSSGSSDSSEDSLSEGNENEDEEAFEPDRPQKKRSRGRRRRRSFSQSGAEAGGDGDQPQKKKKKWKKKNKKDIPIPESVKANLDKQSEFRRCIISRVYWRLNKHRNSGSSKGQGRRAPPSGSSSQGQDSLDFDPRKGYIMEYNPVRKCLFVEDVEVRFNDDLEVLQCTRCSFQTGQNKKYHRSADTLMFHHILGKHLEIYKCRECSQVLGSLHRWQDHIRGHQKLYCCDICGKPMYSSQSLYNHRWSHMNEDEMQEALANGMRDPREKIQRMKERAALRAFICPTCGKGFQTGFLLRLHEQIHREDRERIQCTRCGKTFLPMGFYSHQKYTCRPDGAPLLLHPCHICPDKVFKSKHLLKRHFDRTHAATAEERPHICSICGRGFKTRGELGRHGNAHLETRPWSCGRGCGAAFKHKKNCSRHEANCNGMGTPRGKPTAATMQATSTSMLML